MIEWGRIGQTAAASPVAPFGGGFLTPQAASYGADQIRHDVWAMPYRGPLDLDPHGGETPRMREMYRALYQREGVVAAAIDGKVEGIAAADVTIEPFDRHDPRSRDEAEFLDWSVDQSEGGWDTIGVDTLRPGFLDGWAALEVTLKPALHPKFGWTWALHHCRSLDTRFLRLQLDVYRNVTGVVSLVRGLETFSPQKTLIFTHRRLYHNPFGSSDMRAVHRDAMLIEDAYKVWFLALKMYGEPYLKGTVKNPVNRKQLEDALAKLRAGGYIVVPEGDDVDILSLATAVNFQAFEAKVRNLRENIFLAVRGSYLPFVEGVGGNDSHGDTKVGKGNADAKESLLGKALGRLYTKQLAPILLEPQFGADVVHRLPKVRLGGIDWEAVETVAKTVGDIKDKFAGRVSISQKWLGQALGIPPATDPDDEANVAPPPGGDGGDPKGGSGGGGPGTPPPSPSGIAGGQVPPGSERDGPAPTNPPPPKPDPSPATGFSAADAAQYGSYFAADQHGRFPGDMHKEFGLSVADFARRSALLRKEVGRGADRRWVWVPRPDPEPVKTFSADPQPATVASCPVELAVAMLEAHAAGDDATADALAELADDPDGLAEFVADFEAGTHGVPGKGAFSALAKCFADGVKVFGWAADPTPRSKTRITNSESGQHAYGDKARQIMARQGREERGEPEPEKPHEKAKRLRQEREPARDAARQAWQSFTSNPTALNLDQIQDLRAHLHTLTRDEVREAVRSIRGKVGGKLKADLVEALMGHARGLATHAATKREKPADPARLALAGLQPNRYDVTTAGGEVVPAGHGYERWEGDRKVGYTAGQAAKVAAGVTPEEGRRRIDQHERASRDALLDDVQREYHAELAAQLRGHHEAAFGGEGEEREDKPAPPPPTPTGVVQDGPTAGRRVEMPKEKPARPAMTAAEKRQALDDAHAADAAERAKRPHPDAAAYTPTDDIDRERYDAARDKLDRMQAWLRDRPDSLAATGAVARAADRLRAVTGRQFSAAPDPTHAGLCVRAGDTGRVLVIRRAATPGDPAAGLWEFPGGKIEAGETPLQGAAREWTEEVGTHLPLGQLAGTWRSDDGVYAGHVWDLPTEAAVSLPAAGGDRGEPVAWRHPDELAADDVRPELVDSLPDVVRVFSGPPRDGLVPQSGDPEHPKHWVRPEKADGKSGDAPAAKPAEVETPAPADPPPAEQTRGLVKATLPADTPSGTLAKVADKAVTAAAKVHLALVGLTPAMHAAIEAVSAVIDTPDDMRKFGYQPTSATQHESLDPIKASIGINTHLAATIAAKVIGAGLVYLNRKTGVRLYADEDAVNGAAVSLHDAFAAVAAEFGLEPPPGVEVIAAHIRAVGGRQFAEDAEGHEHGKDGKFARKGGGGSATPVASPAASGDTTNTPTTHPEGRNVGKHKTPPVQPHPETAAEFARTGRANAWRIHNGKKPLPKESGNHWTDQEGETMGGVSGYANLSNALDDMLWGERDSVTGENYTKNIREGRGDPHLVVMHGRTIDAPGGETVVPNPKVSTSVPLSELEPIWRAALKQGMVESGEAVTDDFDRIPAEDLLDRTQWEWSRADRDRAEKAVESYLRQRAAAHAPKPTP